MSIELISGVISGIGLCNQKVLDSNSTTFNSLIKINENKSPAFEDGDCPIAAIECIGFSPNKIINFVDISETFFENTPIFSKIEKLTKDVDSYPIFYYPYSVTSSGLIKYLVTDKLSDNGNGQPLFYQYELLYDAYSDGINNLITLYKNNETIVPPTEYLIEYSTDTYNNGNLRYSSTTWLVDSTNLESRVRILVPVEFNKEDTYFVVKYTKSAYGAKIIQEELTEFTSLYEYPSDYTYLNNAIELPVNSRISNSNVLYMVKDPNSCIHTEEIISIKDSIYQTDKTSSWRLRINTGSFLLKENEYVNSTGNFYYATNVYNSDYIPIIGVKPTVLSDHILKVKEVPIYVDESQYKFPIYNIALYNKQETDVYDTPGKFSIDVNGETQDSYKIKSIDRYKGYIQFENELPKTDEVELTFYTNATGYFLIENLELNPKVPYAPSVSGFHISGYWDGFGILYKVYDGSDANKYPYIYGINDTQATMIPALGDQPPSSVPIEDTDFKLCEIYVNKLTPDLLKITDVRKIGGGVIIDEDLKKWSHSSVVNRSIETDEYKWYNGIGYYGGEPLAHSSTLVIHIPKNKLDDMRTSWINSISEFNDGIENTDRGTKEFNLYLDQLLRKHISAGTSYILVPTYDDGTFSGILNLEY